MNEIDTDPTNLDRRCWINALLVRHDALDCTFQARSWRNFCERVLDTVQGSWGCDSGGIARVFGRENGRAGNGWFHDGTSLYLKLELGDRGQGAGAFTGKEVILLVKSQWGN